MPVYVYVVWLDYKGKWHCHEVVGAELVGSMKGCEQKAIRTAKALTSLIGIAKAAFCIHARTRYKAIKKAKQSYMLKTRKAR